MMKKRQGSVRRRVVLGVAVVLLVGLAGYSAYLYFSKNREYEDPERIAELEKAKLGESAIGLVGATDAVWPQWRGPKRDGISLETDFLVEWPKEGPPKLWEHSVGAGYSSMAVANGRVCTMMQDGDNEVVVCWDAVSGKEVWRFAYPASFKEPHGDGPRSTPTMEGNRIYTVGATGVMHCLEVDPTGNKVKSVWSKNLVEEYDASVPQWGVAFSPLILDDLVYAVPGGPGACLVALNKNTGQEVWKALDDAMGYSSPIAATLAGRKQVVFFSGQAIAGLDPKTGAILWRHPWTTSYNNNISMPLVAGDYVFVCSGYGTGCGVLKIEAGISDQLEASLVYSNNKLQNHFPSSVLYEDHVYGFDNHVLTCLAFRTGQVKWKSRVFPEKGALFVAGGHLIVLGGDGLLGIGKASPDEFKAISTMQVSKQSPCWVTPVLANGLLFVRDKSKLICLDLRLPRVEQDAVPSS
jgi:outer membrane protein assembly factor BamB